MTRRYLPGMTPVRENDICRVETVHTRHLPGTTPDPTKAACQAHPAGTWYLPGMAPGRANAFCRVAQVGTGYVLPAMVPSRAHAGQANRVIAVREGANSGPEMVLLAQAGVGHEIGGKVVDEVCPARRIARG